MTQCNHEAALSWEGVEWCRACGAIRVVDAQDIPTDVWVIPTLLEPKPSGRYAGLCNKSRVWRGGLTHCNKPHGHKDPCWPEKKP